VDILKAVVRGKALSNQHSAVSYNTMKDFRDLKVWKKSHELTLAVYLATKYFPKEELYGLTSQIRRSCSSIPANIAEGCGRGGDGELGRYLQIAMGSASELEYHLLLAHDLQLLKDDKYEALNERVVEVKRMLSSFILKLTADR
jgi:four helix bundle protein